MDPLNELRPDDDPWHAALAAAFGGPVESDPEQPSVLERLEGVGAPAIAISLRPTDVGADAGPVRRPATEPRPTLPARYRVVDEIGRGGMGIVWRVHDVELGRDVAIKVLREEWTIRPERVRRFVEEAQITGQLEHPGVVALYEIGADPARRPWFAMRLVRGETLAKRLSRRGGESSLPGSLLPAFETICQTLAYAHARGVVHRDLKPSNIILGAFGEVQVLDWGLAALLAPASGEAPEVGPILGTPGYMAPEQARGDAAVDARADVFALGAILCEMLTGAPAVVGGRDVALDATARGDLSDAVARLDARTDEPDLAVLAKRCLDPAPAARPRDASEVASAVVGHRARLDAKARTAFAEAAAARAREAADRRARRLALGLVVGGALVAVTAVVSWAAIDRARIRRADAVATRVDRTIRDVDEALARGDATGASDAVGRLRTIADSEDATAEVRARASASDARVAEASVATARGAERRRRDTETLARIDATREEIVALSEGWYPYWSGRGGYLPGRVEAALSDAFRAHGLDVRTLSVAAAARELQASDVREELVAAIDLWAYVVEGFDRRDPRLDAIVRAVDRDPVRARLRDDADLEAVRREARGFDAALGSPADASLIAALLHYYMAGAERIDFLRRACARRPDDYLSTFRLGLAEGDNGLPGVVRASRLFAAATALRPRSAVARAYLGLSLRLVGDPGARDELARALAEDPACWEAHAAALDLDANRGDYEACLAHVEPMERTRPASADYLLRAADIAAALGRVDEASALLGRAMAAAGTSPAPALRARRDWVAARDRLRLTGERALAAAAAPTAPGELVGAAWLAFAASPRASSDLYERALSVDPSLGQRELPGAGVESLLIHAAEASLRTSALAALPADERSAYRERGRRWLGRALDASAAAIAADPGYARIASVDFWSAARGRPGWRWLDDAAARAGLPASEGEAWARLSTAIDELLARCRR